MDTTEVKTEEVRMVARIGSGEKLHPVTVTRKVSNPGTPFARESFHNLRFICNCPGTQSGSSVHRAMLIRGTILADRTCRI